MQFLLEMMENRFNAIMHLGINLYITYIKLDSFKSIASMQLTNALLLINFMAV